MVTLFKNQVYNLWCHLSFFVKLLYYFSVRSILYLKEQDNMTHTGEKLPDFKE